MFRIKGRVLNGSALIRNDSLEGKDCVVIPVIMMVEGVHNGSEGPVYYSSEELGKFPGGWDNKPVVVHHPSSIGGSAVTACQKSVLDSTKVGVLLNTRFEDGKLKSEAWVEVEKINNVDPSILQVIDVGGMLEVSAGMVMDIKSQLGDWHGEKYERVAVNFSPDHLALLPDQIGACSIADGAGIPRLNAEKGQDMQKHGANFVEQRSIENELSHIDVSRAIFEAMDKETASGIHFWIEDVFDTYYVFGIEGQENLFKRNYTIDAAGKVTLSEAKEEVVRRTEYSPVTTNEKEQEIKEEEPMTEVPREKKGDVQNTKNAPEEKPAVKAYATLAEFVQNAPDEFKGDIQNALSLVQETKTALVSDITANEKCDFTEKELTGMSIANLRKLAKLTEKSESEEQETQTTEPKTETVANYAGKAPAGKPVQEEEVLLPPVINFDPQK